MAHGPDEPMFTLHSEYVSCYFKVSMRRFYRREFLVCDVIFLFHCVMLWLILGQDRQK